MALSLPPTKALECGEDFQKWMNSVEIFMTAMNITSDSQKENIVLHLLGSQMQEVYKNLSDTNGTSDESNYETMKRKLVNYYKPTVNPVVERHIFNSMKYECKSVAEYVAQLRNQAGRGNYPVAEVDTHIRDKLVATCPIPKVKEAMLREESLDLNKAIKIWSMDVHVKEQALKMTSNNDPKIEELVNKVKKKSYEVKNESYSKSDRKCFRCGLSNHMIKTCRVPSNIN